MKTCHKCKRRLKPTCFYKHSGRKDGLQSMCKKCTNVHVKDQYTKHRARFKKTEAVTRKRVRAILTEIKQRKGCLKCGARKQLGFHHRDPKTKLFELCRGPAQGRLRALREVKKCDVLCASCHQRLHIKRRCRPLRRRTGL